MGHLTRKTKHLRLRPIAAKDFEVWKTAHLGVSPPKNKWDRGPQPSKELTRDKFKKLLADQKRRRDVDSFYDLGVFDLKGALVGFAAVMEVQRGVSQSAYLGYRIFNSYWQLGYGKEAAKAMIDIAFKDLRLHRLEAGIEPGNIRSMGIAKSLGMRREGLKKRALFLREEWVDLIMYTLTSEDLGLKFDTTGVKFKPRR